MKRSLILCSLLGSAPPAIAAPDLMLGIQPAVTSEPINNQGLDVNVLPLVIEKGLGDRHSLRMRPIVNLRFGSQAPKLSNIGFSLEMPFYWEPRKDSQPYQGFYLAPVFDLSDDITDGTLTSTIAGELGYTFLFENQMVLNVGMQAGASYFKGASTNRLVPHNGIMVSVGFWL